MAIEGIFHDNKEPRAIFLLNEFHSMVQGDSTISAYCQRLKTKAATLRDVGHPVQDSQLILALLRGLNPRFSNTADDIANSIVLPTFTRAHDMLVLKELCLANDE